MFRANIVAGGLVPGAVGVEKVACIDGRHLARAS